MAKEYVLRCRNPDGTWDWNFSTVYSKRDANRAAQINRIIGGTICQVWELGKAESAALSKAGGENG